MKNLVPFILLILILPFSADLEQYSNSTIELDEFYSPGDTVFIKTNFKPEKAFIISPANGTFELRFSGDNGSYSAKFELKERVVLGEYRVFIDGMERGFIVDQCNLSLEYSEGVLRISAKTYYLEPRIEYFLDSEHGKAVGEAFFNLSPGKHEISASCLKSRINETVDVDFRISYNGSIFAELDGKFVNARLKVFADREYEFSGIFDPRKINATEFSVEAEYGHLRTSKHFNFSVDIGKVHFPGESIELSGNFTSGKLVDPSGREYEIRFENGLATVELKKNVILGKYRLILDGFEFEFFVDSYEINATFLENEIVGNVSYYFFEPKEVFYTVNGTEGKVKVDNGTFRIPLNLSEGNYTAKLRVGNAEFSLSFQILERKIYAEKLYFPGEKVKARISFKPEKVILEKPSGTFELNLSYDKGYFVEFDAEEIGKYRILADGAEFEFFVDSYEINAEFAEKLVGKVTWHVFEPSFIEVFDGEWIKLPLLNGSFEFYPKNSFVILKCGNAEITVIREPRNYYFVGELVEIFSKEKPLVRLNESEIEVNTSKINGVIHSSFPAKRAGIYEVQIGEKKISIVVDECRIEANVGNVIEGRVFCLFREPEYIEVWRVNRTEKIPLSNGSFSVEAEGVLKLVYGNAELVLKKPDLRDLYFVGERLEMEIKGAKARLFTPSSLLEFSDEVEYVFKEMGKYRIEIGSFSKEFFVDSYEIEASVNGSVLKGNVSWHFVRPNSLSYRTKLAEGMLNLSENGEFSIALKDGWEFIELRCGNAFLKLIEKRIEVGRIYFVGEKILIKANFRPEESYVLFNGEKIPIEFYERNGSWICDFLAEKVGAYRLFVDGIEREFFVDSCSLEAWIEGKKVYGKASANFTDAEVSFLILPSNSSGLAAMKNGTFKLDLPEGAEEVILICNNSEIRLKPAISDFRSIEFAGKIFNISLSKGKFEELSFDGENASLRISGIGIGEKVEVIIDLPFEIPDGLHVYYWKEINGSFVPVNYTLSEKRRLTFTLQDGVIDEDGEANGVIVDPIKLYIPNFSVEKEIEAKKGKLKVKGENDFEIRVETGGRLDYLAFVDPENLPSRPAEFPYGLIKFRIEVEKGGEAEIKILYPSLEGFLDDEGNITFFKFNPRTLEWSSFKAKVEGSYVVLHFKDGGFGDEDGEENGVISDDGGVGWVGFIGTYGARIISEENSSPHVYWLYVPSGDYFNITANVSRGSITLNVYNSSNNLVQSYNLRSTSNLQISTNNTFGWWRLEFSTTAGPQKYYGLNVTGAEEINLRANTTHIIGNETFYGTNDSMIVSASRTDVSKSRYFYVYACNFKLAIYDPDSGLSVMVTAPDGSQSVWNPTGNNTWNITSYSGDCGVWEINVTQISTVGQDDSTRNYFRIAVNLSEGLYFKPPVVLNIKGRVFHDLFPLGRNDGEDRPISGVEVLLVGDMNGNGIPDSGDRIVGGKLTDSNGNFSFSAVKDITRTYFVVVNSRTINAANASLSYNSGYSIGHVWAEQTFQTNDSNYSQLIPFFGGRSELSDNVSYSGNIFAGRAEHFITINCSSYNNETLYFGFNFSVVTNTRDADDDTANPRSCQGCFRQFVLNSNAISGKQRSYFVMSVPANAYDSNGSWWFISLNASLGSLDISDSIEINGTLLRADMSVNDSNQGYVSYDYETKDLKSVDSRESIPVGVGIDGIPFSGDEAMLYAIPKPEVEIYGSNLNPVLNLSSSASNSEIRNISVFGSNYDQYPGVLRSYAENLTIENVFAGLRANGTDPKSSGLNRTGGANLWLEGNNTTVLNSIVAFAERYGLLFYTSSVKAGRAENVIAFRNALTFAGGDNIGMENYASNVTIERCVSAKAAAQGIESWYGGKGIRILNCSVEANAFGNETGSISETAGIRIHANDSLVAYSLIRDNFGHGIAVVRYNKDVFNVTITRNSIYNNTKLGIDLVNADNPEIAHRGDNVTLNDGLLNCSMANCGVDYPVITISELDGDQLYVEGFIGNESIGGSSNFANASIEIYLVRNSTNGDSLIGNNWSNSLQLPRYYGEGWIYLGSLNADSSGYFSGYINVAGKGVDSGSIITAMTIFRGNSSEFGPNARISKKLNVSAEISLYGMNATIKVRAHENARDVTVYWIKPYGLSVTFSGDYNSNGSSGSVYWWKFNSINRGEEKYVNLSFSGTDFMVSESLNIGLDPD
jgi:hypothetical protein